MAKGRYEHVPNVPMHEGHDPFDPRVLVVEDLAMVQCGYCGNGRLRWRDRQYGIWCHQDELGYEADECEIGHMLSAATDLGIPIYTGAELEFPDEDE